LVDKYNSLKSYKHLQHSCVYGFGRVLRSEIYFCIVDNNQQHKLTVYPKDIEVCYGLIDVLNNPGSLFFKPTSVYVRKLLQWWGTEYRRRQDPEWWIKRWEETINSRDFIGVDPIIVDDIRYENEYQAVVKQPDSLMIMLTRDGIERQYNHSSEDFSWYNKDLPNTFEYKLTDKDLHSAEYIYEAIQKYTASRN